MAKLLSVFLLQCGSIFKLTKFVIIAWLAVVSSTANAAPQMNICNDLDSGERLKCKFNNILIQQESTVGMLGDNNSIPASQRQAMKNQLDRSKRAQGRSDATDFKQLTKKSKSECQIAEIIGDGIGDDDGVCKAGNEACVEVSGDGIGDDDGVCRVKGKPSEREICAQICDAEAVNSNPDNFDDDPTVDSLGRDLEEQLDESATQFEELNNTLASEMAAQDAFRSFVASGDECAAIFEARPSFEASVLASQLAVTLRGVAGQAAPVCQFDISGFNGAIACVVTETIAAISEVVANGISLLDEEIDSDTIDATYKCLGDLNASVGEANEELSKVTEMLSSLESQLNILQEQTAETNRLLLEPQGQRDGFSK
jgi:hypothetical protein